MTLQWVRANRRLCDALLGAVRAAPVWTIVAFAAAVGFAYSPGIVSPAAIHGNYEALVERSHGLFHSDAARMIEFARPVSALLSNLPLLPLEQMSDFGWVRAFSVLTVCVSGALMIGICIRYLRMAPLVALV